MLLSLGDTCITSQILRDINIRKKAYPFDWIKSNIKNVVEIIIKILIMNDNEIDEFVLNMFNHKDGKISIKEYDQQEFYINTKLDFHFLHDTVGDNNTIQKYQKRYKRLRDDLLNETDIDIIYTVYLGKWDFNDIMILYNHLYSIKQNINLNIYIFSGIQSNISGIHKGIYYYYVEYPYLEYNNDFYYYQWVPCIKKIINDIFVLKNPNIYHYNYNLLT